MPARATRPSVALTAVVLMILAVAACGTSTAPSASGAGSAAPSDRSSSSPSVEPTAAATPDPVVVAAVPTACFGLDPQDCQRAGDAAVAAIAEPELPITYLLVGPFGCADGKLACPGTLDARPEGDVTVEIQGRPAIGIHVRMVGDVPSAERSEIFGVVLEPTAGQVAGLGPRPFDLGHCGIWSGFDVGGSWWDPVGPVDADHTDAINAASGILTVNDEDHAIFVSAGGLTVRLLRRDGPKYFPFCA